MTSSRVHYGLITPRSRPTFNPLPFGWHLVWKHSCQSSSTSLVSEFKSKKGYPRPNQSNLGSNNFSNSANIEWPEWSNWNNASDNAKPSSIDTRKARKKHLPLANQCSSLKHGSVPCRGNYGSDGQVPSGSSTSLMTHSNSADLPGTLSKAG